jgi:hypothetical protein
LGVSQAARSATEYLFGGLEASMTGEELQGLVTGFLDMRYPDGWSWLDSEFDCFGDTPLQLKMIPAFNALEYNISNGGGAQFLWNCWGCWPQLLDIAQPGYRLIGAHYQANAIDDLRRLCERDDQECEAAMINSVKENNFNYYFEPFTSRIITEPGNDWQELFFHDSGAYETRLRWLEDNEALVRQLIDEAAA